jgi:Flp pilus assembly protein TadD
MASGLPGWARRAALALVLAGGLGSASWLWWTCVRQPEICFLPNQAPAQWVLYPAAPKGTVHRRVEMSTLFRRSFTVQQVPAKAELRVAGLRHYAVAINGKQLAGPARRGRNWKQPDQYDVAPDLRPGENQMVVTVWHSNGPPVLWLCLDAGALRLNSDESWETSYGGAAWRRARLASEPTIPVAGSPVYGSEDPGTGLRARWLTLLVFAGLSAAVYWVMSRRLPIVTWRGEVLVVAVLAGLWGALFANNLEVLPALTGFDVGPHMAYVRYVQEYHALPRANEGWEMFQPPLYYVLGAALLSLLSLSVTQDGGVIALRLMGLVIGVAHFFIVLASLRLLFPGERSRQWWGVVLAAALPPLLYLSQYVSNEGLAAALVSACVCLTLRMLRQERVSWKAGAGLGLCLGAALLTKSTALLAVPVLLGALVGRGMFSRSLGVPRLVPGLAPASLALVVCVAVCGWHYARVWAQYGSLVIGVWDPRLGFSWWQDDGYRTGSFYLRFGAVLVHPWFSSFKSFADGIYATLWGDGLFGGAADAVARPPWNYNLMAVGYWLAVVPSIAIAVGAILMFVKFLREPSAESFLLLGLAFLTALALVHLSITLPYYCHVKAFYGLCALVPLCAFGAYGFEAIDRRGPKLRPALGVLFGVWAINSYAAFWVSRSAAATVFARAQSLEKQGRNAEVVDLLKLRLAQDTEHSADLRPFLAFLLMDGGDAQEAAQLAETAVRQQPDDPIANLVLGTFLARQQRFDEAAQHLRRVVQLAPTKESAYEQLASLLLRQGRNEEAIRTARNGLAVATHSPALHCDLGAALVSRGEHSEGIAQLQLACALDPKWPEPWLLLGTTLAAQGRPAEAMRHLREAVRLEPGNAEAHCQLAVALSAQHQTAEAIACYSEALHLEPDFAVALNNLAWIRAADPRAEFRDGSEAVRLAERACKVTGFKEPVLVGTLAAACAEAGRFDEAVAMARKARDLALAGGQKDLANKNLELFELFTQRHPYRETALDSNRPAP